MRRSREQRSSPAETAGTGRQLKRATSLKRCVDFFGGPRMPSSLKQILPPALLIRHDLRTPAFLYGPRSKLPRMSSVGRGHSAAGWLDVLLYTGLRRGDAVRLGRQHVRNGVATIKTEKNDTEVTLPDPASVRRNITGRTMRRSDVHNRREWPSTRQTFIRKSVSEGVSCGGRAAICTRASQGRGHASGERGCNGRGAGSDFWLVRRPHGVALYARRRSTSVGSPGDA